MSIDEFLKKCKEKNLDPVVVLAIAIQQVFNDYEKALEKDNEKNKLLAEAKGLFAVANFEWGEDARKADELYNKIKKVLT